MLEINSIPDVMNSRTERWTGRVLRLGVWVSASLMISGLFIAAIHPSSIVPFSGNPTFHELLIRLFSDSFEPVTLMFAGLVMLMLTPLLRVVTALIGFARERDWRFVLVACGVLLLLMGEIAYSLYIKG
jgi:uncharacterized membrane protein